MLTREQLKPGMKVRKSFDFPFMRPRIGVICSDPADPEKILAAATGDLSVVPVLVGSTTHDWWPLDQLEIVE